MEIHAGRFRGDVLCIISVCAYVWVHEHSNTKMDTHMHACVDGEMARYMHKYMYAYIVT